MNTNFSKDFRSLCSWIPGSWATPPPRNDKVYFKLRHYRQGIRQSRSEFFMSAIELAIRRFA